MDIRNVTNANQTSNIPKLAPGDTVKVTFRTVEGDKERTQHFQGVVIKIKKGVPAGSFTLRRSAYGIGVERTFFFMSPNITKIEVIRHGKVRRAKLYYLRRLSAKEARLKERQEAMTEKALTGPSASIGSSGDQAKQVTASEAQAPSGQSSPSTEDSK